MIVELKKITPAEADAYGKVKAMLSILWNTQQVTGLSAMAIHY